MDTWGCGQKVGLHHQVKERESKVNAHTLEQVKRALKEYESLGSVAAVVNKLGYPSRSTLFSWINQYNETKDYSFFKRPAPQKAPHFLSPSQKIDVLQRCFVRGEPIAEVAKEVGVCTVSIYNWRKKFEKEGSLGLMSKNDIRSKALSEPEPGNAASSEELKMLKEIVRSLQMEIDLLKETINLLKKDQGIDKSSLKNKEKVVIVDAVKKMYPLQERLRAMKIPRSSYYYHKRREKKPDPDQEKRELIREAFEQSKQTYGYRRVHILLKNKGITMSEKVIRRLMKEMNLMPRCKKKKRFSSYQGEISPAPDDLVQRNFHSGRINELWLTDISEFTIPAGKVYLSPVVDCCDGGLTSWSIGTRPNEALTNRSLLDACQTLKEDEHPILHSDRGCHYRWPTWIAITEENGVRRSMSKKGCSPDNAACEGFFGRFKNEFFFGRDFSSYSLDSFMQYLDDCLHWYNNDRIKLSFGCSPMEYRKKLNLI